MRLVLYLLLFVFCSCDIKQSPESKDRIAFYSIAHESLMETNTKDFKTISDSILQRSDYILKLNQNSVILNYQILSRNLLAEILDKKGEVVNSVRITTTYPKTENELIRRSLYIVGEINLYPFKNAIGLSGLYDKFDELSLMLEKKSNLVKP